MRDYSIEPEQPWQPGDRALCLKACGDTDPELVVGRIYSVRDVWPVANHTGVALTIANVAMPEGARGFWSGRFVRMGLGAGNLARLEKSTNRSWSAAYKQSLANIQARLGHGAAA